MTKDGMTVDQEYDFYSQPENQEPQGPPRRRDSRLSSPIPVRFPPELLREIRRRADQDDRSVSSWIRRAVEHEICPSKHAVAEPDGSAVEMDSLLQGTQDNARFEVFKDRSGKFRFRQRASNGQVIAEGEAYPTEAGAFEGVSSKDGQS